MHRIRILRRLALAAMLLAFCVVVFGAYVRLTDAGLGCPDWPGCYGHVTPVGAAAAASDGTLDAATAQAPLHVGKAWREMIHRYGASTLGLIIVVNAVLTFLWRRQVGVSPGLPMVLVVLVIFQGLLGMWTVTLLLKPLIVTLHLVFGLTTLSMLWWLWLSLRRRSSGPWAGGTSSAGGGLHSALVRPAPMGVRRAALIGVVALALQIMLGGWTSTNYSAVACPDFPKCQGAWWPEADYKDAFVLWRGLGINYEGGVLQHPARVAIHFTHRLGAIVATLALLFAGIAALRASHEVHTRWAAVAVLLALALQLVIGISMVMRGFPLWLATAHNAGAALLLLSTLALNRALRRV
ncbi:MAG: COX15/CtaA family protein [Proteobacteria bacterium]|jgi:cytochrome c oxidase assembly protein subunit 15|nr:COX15/CtaA family protein [Pseudomonadota bacterium]